MINKKLQLIITVMQLQSVSEDSIMMIQKPPEKLPPIKRSTVDRWKQFYFQMFLVKSQALNTWIVLWLLTIKLNVLLQPVQQVLPLLAVFEKGPFRMIGRRNGRDSVTPLSSKPNEKVDPNKCRQDGDGMFNVLFTCLIESRWTIITLLLGHKRMVAPFSVDGRPLFTFSVAQEDIITGTRLIQGRLYQFRFAFGSDLCSIDVLVCFWQ